MRRSGIRHIIGGSLVVLTLIAAGDIASAGAQAPPNRAGTTGGGGIEGAINPVSGKRTQGLDTGWIGLLGLAGLLGRRRRTV